MVQFVIQVHPHRSPLLDIADLRSQCGRLATETALVRRWSWQDSFDDHPYVNVTFETDHPNALSTLLHQQLYQADAFGQLMQSASIATCEGRHGWDDYLLLQHFDPTAVCDSLP